MTELIVPFDNQDDGIEFRFRGMPLDDQGEPAGDELVVTLEVPPLNLDSLRRVSRHIERAMGLAQIAPEMADAASSNVQAVQDVVEIVYRALKQNYRSVPRWLVEQSINMANMPSLYGAVMDVSGLRRKDALEKKAQAAAPSLPTGTPSTAT